MANVTFKVALNNKGFPPIVGTDGLPVLDSGYDVAPRVNPAFAGGTDNIDWNLIQVQYAQDMMPTPTGYRAVTTGNYYAALSPPPAYAAPLTVRSAAALRSVSLSASQRTIVTTGLIEARGPSTDSALYAVTESAVARLNNSLLTAAGGARSLPVLVASVGSDVYLFRKIEDQVSAAVTTRFLKYLGGVSTSIVIPVLPAGVSADQIVAMTGAGNYLILATSTAVYWSTPTDPMEFNNIPLGSGSQIPVDLRSIILRVEEIAGGFVIYSADVAIMARATNNAATPFSFSVIRDSAGIRAVQSVAVSPDRSCHYVHTRAGMQKVTVNAAEYILPDVNNWIARGVTSAALAAVPGTATKNPVSYVRCFCIDSALLLISLVDSLDSASALQHIIVSLEDNRYSSLPAKGAAYILPRTLLSAGSATEFVTVQSLDSLSGVCGVPTLMTSDAQIVSLGLPLAASELATQNARLCFGPVSLRRARTTTITEVRVRYSTNSVHVAGGVLVPELSFFYYNDTGTVVSGTAALVSTSANEWVFHSRFTAAAIYCVLRCLAEIHAITVTAQPHGIA